MLPMVVGCDIGYGNLKVVYGRRGEPPVERVLPSGAGPVAMAPRTTSGEINLLKGHLVNVRGESWVAGVQGTQLQGYSRVLHANYPETDHYWSLYMAALLETKSDYIDVLVTGLPVYQFTQQPELKQRLKERLAGTHQPVGDRKIHVETVLIREQPLGAYFDAWYVNQAKMKELEKAHILVVDAGFYSVDYVVLYMGDVFHHYSSSSTLATGDILERAASKMASTHAATITKDMLEAALREGRNTIMVYSQEEPFMTYVESAARQVGKQVADEILNTLRTSQFNIGCVIMTGGAANLYASSLQAAFPKAFQYSSHSPVAANARGFHRMGLRQAAKAAQK